MSHTRISEQRDEENQIDEKIDEHKQQLQAVLERIAFLNVLVQPFQELQLKSQKLTDKANGQSKGSLSYRKAEKVTQLYQQLYHDAAITQLLHCIGSEQAFYWLTRILDTWYQVLLDFLEADLTLLMEPRQPLLYYANFFGRVAATAGAIGGFLSSPFSIPGATLGLVAIQGFFSTINAWL